jgi:hypothetical protein
MDIKKLLSEIEADTRVDELNLREVQFKLPAIKHKYAGLLIRSKIELNEKRKKYEEAKKSLVKKIKDSSPVKLTLNVLNDAADETPSLKNINEDIRNLLLVIELLEKTEKTLSSMTFDIKNIIEIQKLETT